MLPRYIPEDINAELLLAYLPEGSCKVAFKGMHKRNSYNDIINIDEKIDGSLLLDIGRNSLYNSLPEFMFHSVDRFDNIPKSEEKERFAEEYEKQEKEKENAYKFFAPLDLLLLKLRVEVRKRLNKVAENNKVLIDIIGDQLTDLQKSNRFIRQALNFIPMCKYIRGDEPLLSFMLRKIFMEEGLKLEKHSNNVTYKDERPRYDCCVGGILEDSYVGNVFDAETISYDIHYWPEEDCDEYFLKFIEEINQFQSFIQDYFISIEETLCFCICKEDAPLRLSDEMVYNYLNYNTNL